LPLLVVEAVEHLILVKLVEQERLEVVMVDYYYPDQMELPTQVVAVVVADMQVQLIKVAGMVVLEL
jgi:hypothetical protein